MSTSNYRNDYPVADGRMVCQGHADACAEYGHATWVIDGIDQGVCPRCNEVTRPAAATIPATTPISARARRNHNYAIGTDELPDGRIKAKAHGRKTNVRTFPAGTTHEAAALALATTCERDRIPEVRELSRNDGGTKRDFAIYVTH